jgi:hypothetical protein
MLALFRRLGSDSDLQMRFLDCPAEVLAAETGVDVASQKVSADNELLVALLLALRPRPRVRRRSRAVLRRLPLK